VYAIGEGGCGGGAETFCREGGAGEGGLMGLVVAERGSGGGRRG
jgi:hypothetical protein